MNPWLGRLRKNSVYCLICLSFLLLWGHNTYRFPYVHYMSSLTFFKKWVCIVLISVYQGYKSLCFSNSPWLLYILGDLNVNGLKKASFKAADGCNTIITELKQIFFKWRTRAESWLFAFSGGVFTLIFWKIVSIRAKTLSNANLVPSRHIRDL